MASPPLGVAPGPSRPSLQGPTPFPPRAPQAPQLPSFHQVFAKHMEQLVKQHEANPKNRPLLQMDRRNMIKKAHSMTEKEFFPDDSQLNAQGRQHKSLTKVFYHVIADEPWSENWIRAPDVERKLSRYEFHVDSIDTARANGFHLPKDAINAARRDLRSTTPVHNRLFEEINIIYVPGTVSSVATNNINRDDIYPISVESIAHQLENHILKDSEKKLRPYDLAYAFIRADDEKTLLEWKRYASDMCDFAPHLLDNDNISLLIVLLILGRSEVCGRFADQGIRIEGSTLSHRKSECMKNHMGWKTQEDKWGFDSAAVELQKRIKKAANPHGTQRTGRRTRKSFQSIASTSNPSTPVPGTPIAGTPFPQSPGLPNGVGSILALEQQRRASQAAAAGPSNLSPRLNGTGTAGEPMEIDD